MDKIIMKGMKFFGRHGVFPQEKELGQLFEVDVEVTLDLEQAGKNDSLQHTVSYAELFETVKSVVTGKPLNLIEAVAHQISSSILRDFPLISNVKVVIKKPAAPIKGTFDYMGVEISRQRQGL